jgi:hypothetical protein
MKSLDRRTLLRGAGVAMALPWLEAMSPRRAQAQTFPKRLIIFFTPNGYIEGPWMPTGSGTDFTLGVTLKPLEPHKQDIVVLGGVDQTAAYRGPGDDHQRGVGTLLTNVSNLPGNSQGGCCAPSGLAGGISVDQEIVRVKRPPTKFPSLELGVQAGSLRGGTVWHYVNYKGAGMPLPADNSPVSVYNRIFGNFQAPGAAPDTGAVDKLRLRRKSVLDAVARSYKALETKLGVDDRRKLEAHATSVVELEKRLASDNGTAPLASCRKPAPPPSIDVKAMANFPMLGKLQMDLMVQAMACDLTRVGTVQWSNSAAQPRYPWIGISGQHHSMAHDNQADKLALIDRWYAEQFGYLIGALRNVREGSGTMLDNTLVVWCNELSSGDRHSHRNIPLVLAGRAGGQIKTGRYLSWEKISHSHLLVSLLNAFDVPATTFGNPEYGTGPLPGLLG